MPVFRFLVNLSILAVLSSCSSRQEPQKSIEPRTSSTENLKWKVKGPFFVGSNEFLKPTDLLRPLYSGSPEQFEVSSSDGRIQFPYDLQFPISTRNTQDLWVQWEAESRILIEKPGHYFIFASGVSELIVDGQKFPGEFPGASPPVFGAYFQAGEHPVKVICAGLLPNHFVFRISPQAEGVQWIDEKDEDFRPLPKLTKRVRAGRLWNLTNEEISLSKFIEKFQKKTVSAPSTLSANSVARIAYEEDVSPQNLDSSKPYRVGFLSSIDESPQYFAILEPKNYDPTQKYALILALHGANIRAMGHLGTFKQKDWAFVVAPSNRGPLGLGWNDLAIDEAREVLNLVKANYSIDSDRVYLSGHSMGGQGALHFATKHPDLFAAVSLQAAWIEPELYLPSNFSLSSLLSNSQLREFRDRLNGPYRHTHLLENAKSLPFLISTANQDSVVNPLQSRMLFDLLKKKGFEVQKVEHESKDHFCEVPSDERGYLCTDFKAQEDFFKSHERKVPKNWTYAFYDSKGLDVFQMMNISQESPQNWSEASWRCRGSNSCELQTKNISSFESANNLPTFIWNGQKVKSESVKNRKKYSLTKGNPRGGWKDLFSAPLVIAVDDAKRIPMARYIQRGLLKSSLAFAPILKLSELKNSSFKDRNILYLGLVQNTKDQIPEALPFMFENRAVSIGTSKRTLAEGYGAWVLRPSPFEANRLMGLGLASDEKNLESLSGFHRFLFRLGQGMPDFLVFDESFPLFEWGAVTMAGFFSDAWDVQSRELYLKPE